MDAHSPARKADCQTLQELRTWYAGRPHLKKPPIIGILTHVDLLPPPLVWEPPYDWRNPDSEKEVQIAEAVNYAFEVLEENVVDIVPACLSTDKGRQSGITDEILPTLLAVLDDARCVAMLRIFESDLDVPAVRTLLRQSKVAGYSLVRSWLDAREG